MLLIILNIKLLVQFHVELLQTFHVVRVLLHLDFCALVLV